MSHASQLIVKVTAERPLRFVGHWGVARFDQLIICPWKKIDNI